MQSKKTHIIISMDEESRNHFKARACLEYHKVIKDAKNNEYEECEHGAQTKYGNEAFLMRARWQDFIQENYPELEWSYEDGKKGQVDLFFDMINRYEFVVSFLKEALPELTAEDYQETVLPLLEKKMGEFIDEIITSQRVTAKSKGSIEEG